MFWKRRKHSVESSAEQGHLHIATEAAARAEWGHALVHLAAALENEPADPGALALLERVLRSARDPLKQLPLAREGETPYQIVAMLAYVHAWSGRFDEAVSVMTQVYQAVPGTPYFPWLLDWLSSPNCPDRVRPENMAALISTMMTKFPGEPPADGNEILEQLRPLFTRFWEAHRGASLLGSVLSILVRRLGHVDEAIAIATATYEAHPDYAVAASLGVAYVRKGDRKAAIEAYRRALEHDPSALDLRLDLGDLLCSTGQIEAGVETYRQVLEQEPDHAVAMPSYLYFQHQLDPGGSWAEQLERYIVEHPDSARARELDAYLDPYVSYLPEPSDATINLLRQVVQQKARIEHFEIELSALESPSARRAVELYQEEQYGHADLIVRVGEVQQPDPRVPHGPADFVLWHYTGTDPRPAIGPPAAPVAQAVAALAAHPFGAQAWWDLARPIADGLEPRNVKDLLGTMVHPPQRPESFPVWVWLHCVQVAAAFVIAQLGDGWEGSPRKRVLFSLARGPLDWTVGAAIVALAQIAHHEPETVPDVAALYLELLEALPTSGGIPYLHALLRCSMGLPVPPGKLSDQLHDALERLRGTLQAPLGDAERALAEKHIESGIALGASGDHDGAIACCDRAIRIDPSCARAFGLRGLARFYLGELDTAIADYDEAIRLDPRLAAAYNNRAIARKARGDPEGAIADYGEAIRLNPHDALAYRNRGSARSEKGDYDGAIADYTEAIRLDPLHAGVFNSRANIYLDLGEFDRAIADYSQAIRLDPQDAGTYRNRGIARGRKGDTRGALADFDQAVRLDPQSAESYSDRGTEYQKKGEHERAIADYTTAIQLNPEYGLAYSNRAAARCDLHDYDGAIADCDAAIRLNPEHATAYNNRAYAHLKKGEYHRAIADADAAIRLRPHGYFYNNRGQARGALGDYAGAVTDLQEALRLAPDHPEAADIRAKIAEWRREA